MNGESEPSQTRGPQFSLRWLLLVTTGASLYVAYAVAMVGGRWPLLESMTSEQGLSGIGCLLLMSIGFVLMVVNLALSRSGYFWPGVPLCVAMIYAGANVVLFFVTLILIDSFFIFSPVYMISAGVVGPGVMLLALAIFTGFVRQLGVLGSVGYFVMIAGVSFAHLWVVAIAAASV